MKNETLLKWILGIVIGIGCGIPIIFFLLTVIGLSILGKKTAEKPANNTPSTITRPQ